MVACALLLLAPFAVTVPDSGEYVYILQHDLAEYCNDKAGEGFSEGAACRVGKDTGVVEEFLPREGAWRLGILDSNDKYVAISETQLLDADMDTYLHRVRVYRHDRQLVREIEGGHACLFNPAHPDELAVSTEAGWMVCWLDGSQPDCPLPLDCGYLERYYWDASGENFHRLSYEKAVRWNRIQRKEELITRVGRGMASPGGNYEYMAPLPEDGGPGFVYDRAGNPLHYTRLRYGQASGEFWWPPHYLLGWGFVRGTVKDIIVVLDCGTGREWHVPGIPLRLVDGAISYLAAPGELARLPLTEEHTAKDRLWFTVRPLASGMEYVPDEDLMFLTAPEAGCAPAVYTWKEGERVICSNMAFDCGRTIGVGSGRYSCTCTDCEGVAREYGPWTFEEWYPGLTEHRRAGSVEEWIAAGRKSGMISADGDADILLTPTGTLVAQEMVTLSVTSPPDQGTVLLRVNGGEAFEVSGEERRRLHRGDRISLKAVPLVNPEKGVHTRFSVWKGHPKGALGREETEFTLKGSCSPAAVFVRRHRIRLSVRGEGAALLLNDGTVLLERMAPTDEESVPLETLVDEGTVVEVRADTRGRAGWLFRGWEVDGVHQPDTEGVLSLGACARNIEVRAVFERGREVEFVLSPPTIPSGEHAGMAPGVPEAACASALDCREFRAVVASVQPQWRLAGWSLWEGDTWPPLGFPEPDIPAGDVVRLRVQFEEYSLPGDVATLLGFAHPDGATDVFFKGAEDDCLGGLIPDMLEMAAIDWMLNHGSGQTADAVRGAYRKNLMTALDWLNPLALADPGFPLLSAVSATAAAALLSSEHATALLRTAGVEGQHSVDISTRPEFRAVAALLPGGDADGDGFTNLDEWLYWDWTRRPKAVPPLLPEHAEAGGSEGAVTGESLAAATRQLCSAEIIPDFSGHEHRKDAPPCINVVIRRDGLGGDILPPPGSYMISQYKLQDWWFPVHFPQPSFMGTGELWKTLMGYPMHFPQFFSLDDSPYGPATFTITTRRSGDWFPRNWSEGSFWSKGPEPCSTGKGFAPVVVPVRSRLCVVVPFVERPGISELDLHADVVSFLVATGAASREEYYSLVLDTGEFDSANFGGWVVVGNGIPDCLEVGLLERVLKEVRMEFPHDLIWETFMHNLEKVRAFLPDESPSVQRGVTALMCLSDYGHSIFVNQALKRALEKEVTIQELENGGVFLLEPDGDCDGDGKSNLKEYEALSNIFSKEKVRGLYPVSAANPNLVWPE